jgi:hypothetical protein
MGILFHEKAWQGRQDFGQSNPTRDDLRQTIVNWFVGGITQPGHTALVTNLSSSTFGRIQSANDPRILQFALKLHF